MAQEFAKRFYKSKLWQRARELCLMTDGYTCRQCGRPAAVVHHKIKLTKDNINNPNITINQDNLISLCDDCHYEKHRGEHGTKPKEKREDLRKKVGYTYIFGADGQLIPANPPGSK